MKTFFRVSPFLVLTYPHYSYRCFYRLCTRVRKGEITKRKSPMDTISQQYEYVSITVKSYIASHLLSQNKCLHTNK